MTGLGLTANSDIVSLYLEPQFGLLVQQPVPLVSRDTMYSKTYGLGYNVYAEIYITPIKNLEWYFEAEIGNVGSDGSGGDIIGLGFNGTTGVTWYLPAL